MINIKYLYLILVMFLLSNCALKKQERMNASTGVDSKDNPFVIAHRGGAKLAPENTLASFKNAIRLGADMIEIDIHLSKDSEIIVIHDDSLNRTTNGTGNIKDLTLEEIKKYDAGSWFGENFKNEKVPTLAETFKTINGKAKLLIEIKDGDEKYPGLEKKLVESIKKHKVSDWVIIQSFNKSSILRIKKINPKLVTYYLMGGNFDDFYSEVSAKIENGETIEKKFNGIAPHHSLLDKQKVKLLHNAGFGVFTFTVNKVEQMNEMIDIKVDGIITDIPDVLIDRLK